MGRMRDEVSFIAGLVLFPPLDLVGHMAQVCPEEVVQLRMLWLHHRMDCLAGSHMSLVHLWYMITLILRLADSVSALSKVFLQIFSALRHHPPNASPHAWQALPCLPVSSLVSRDQPEASSTALLDSCWLLQAYICWGHALLTKLVAVQRLPHGLLADILRD